MENQEQTPKSEEKITSVEEQMQPNSEDSTPKQDENGEKNPTKPTKKTLSEAQALEQYRVALDNAEKQPQIAAALEPLSYNTDKIAEGKTLWQATNDKYLTNKKKDDNKIQSYSQFTTSKGQLAGHYSLHRKKAKVIFRKEPDLALQLAVSGALPKAYVKWLETIKKFYIESNTDTTLQPRLLQLQITQEQITEGLTLIDNIEAARSNYLRDKGEAQEATREKDNAFKELEDWMKDFYAVAEIALIEHPQLIEALGKVVKR